VQAYNFAQDLGWVFLLVFFDPRSRTPATVLEATYLFGEYLFSAFPLRKLYAEVYEYNADVVSQLERVGWREEGRFAEHVWYQDRYWSLIRLALFREEWSKQKERIAMLIDGQHGFDVYYEASQRSSNSHSTEIPA
jgi:RimJ/RimL family protein N-acetyltransferase